jgi:2-dehydro-3-deoxyphosphogluconate aldolase/(4S)-4-hydroxy-2-oxoglutarate aldolase
MNVTEICSLAPVVPVLVIDDLSTAAPIAHALVAGGLPVLEVTLRTPVALRAIEAMAEAAPDAVVGAGSLRTPEDVAAVKRAGGVFGVSPGWTPALLDAADSMGLPMLPGVATPSEAMRAAERGLEVLKFFPAQQNGGAPALKAWGGPLPGIKFCPTGGVTPENATDYLSLSNVICVGGSWIAPKDAVAAKDWDLIEGLAKEAAALGR